MRWRMLVNLRRRKLRSTGILDWPQGRFMPTDRLVLGRCLALDPRRLRDLHPAAVFPRDAADGERPDISSPSGEAVHGLLSECPRLRGSAETVALTLIHWPASTVASTRYLPERRWSNSNI